MAQARDLLLPRVEDIHTWMVRAICDHSNHHLTNGLAIIIGCKNSSNPDHRTLTGVDHDLRELNKTFQTLRFVTLCLPDPTKEHIMRVMQITSQLNCDAIKLPESWRRIVVTFSGHGGDGDLLYTKDDSISLDSEIVTPILQAKQLIPHAKLFFIDTCRGKGKNTGIDLETLKMYGRGDSQYVARGDVRPTVSNFLIAHSTLLGMEAIEDASVGGMWTHILSHELINEENTGLVLESLLRKVNNLLHIAIPQQPVHMNALNEDVNLLEEAKMLILLEELRRQELEQQLQLFQQQQQQQQQEQQLQHLEPDHAPGHSNMTYTDGQQQQQYISAGVHNYSQQPVPIDVPVFSGGNGGCQWQGSEVDEAFQGLQIEGSSYQAGAIPPQAIAIQNESSCQSQASGAEWVHIQQAAVIAQQNQQGFFRNQLNTYQQKGIIRSYEFTDFSSPPTYQFLFCVEVHMANSPQFTVHGSSKPTKAAAKESAAEKACEQIEMYNSHQGRGTSKSVSSPTSTSKKKTSQKKIWKSKLKEYFDAEMRGKVVEIKYDTKLDGSLSYRSTVFCPKVGSVTGEKCSSKQDAEHSAAQKALELLNSD